MKTLLVVVILACASSVSLSQTLPACDHLPKNLTVRGLRLHQSLTDARRSVPLLKIKRKANGITEASLGLLPGAPRPASLQDVQVIGASFVDQSLYSVTVIYKKTAVWYDAGDFVTDISRKLGLPHPAEWSVYHGGLLILTCGHEAVIAGIEDDHPMVMLFDGSAVDKIITREKAAAFAREEMIEALREEQRVKFKP